MYQGDSNVCRVLSLDLYDSTEGADLVEKAMLLYSLEAATEKAQSPLSFNLISAVI